ncbi:MAG: GDYXXLXY domain-containing protein [Planctomycetaceae bacterium]|nr:GDYXXLXY domain-containing protein [Planctomycetaceae bacterium]
MFDPSLSPETAVPIGPGGTIWHNLWRTIDRYQRHCIVAALVLQLGVLSSMIVTYCLPLLLGQRIHVSVVANDMLGAGQGRSMYFTYEFSKPAATALAGVPSTVMPQPYEVERWLNDRPVYVSLELKPGTNIYQPVRYSVDKPTSGVYLQGKASESYGYDQRIEFGIEEWIVTESERAAINAAMTAGSAQAELAVSPWGTARLVSVK